MNLTYTLKNFKYEIDFLIKSSITDFKRPNSPNEILFFLWVFAL